MRAGLVVVVAMVAFATSPVAAGPLGLELGMTLAQVKAKKPCTGWTEVPERGSWRCKNAKYAGVTFAIELRFGAHDSLYWMRLEGTLGNRKAATAKLAKLIKTTGKHHGKASMIGGPDDVGTGAPVFANVDKTYERFKGRMASASMFSFTKDAAGVQASGQLARAKTTYHVELTFLAANESR